jgi:hypothetical protein
MQSSINNTSVTANLSVKLPADTTQNRARLQLLFIGALFVSCATIGYLRMGELFVSSQSVPLIGTLLGM